MIYNFYFFYNLIIRIVIRLYICILQYVIILMFFFNQPVFNLIEVETFSHLNCIKFQLLYIRKEKLYIRFHYILFNSENNKKIKLHQFWLLRKQQKSTSSKVVFLEDELIFNIFWDLILWFLKYLFIIIEELRVDFRSITFENPKVFFVLFAVVK